MKKDLLLTRISQNDQEAFDELIRRYYLALRNFAMHIVKDDQDAADVVQEAFIRLFEMRSEIAGIGSIDNYLYVSVRNIAVNHLRNERRLADKHSKSKTEENKSDEFWAFVIEEETRRIIAEAIDKLPRRSATVLRLTLYGLSQEEIANEMGISLNTVKSIKAFAITKLKKLIGPLALLFL